MLENKKCVAGNEFVLHNKVLAVWDCPYVKQYKNAIASFVEVSGLEPFFKKNKN